MIGLTGLGDRLHPEWVIGFAGMRKERADGEFKRRVLYFCSPHYQGSALHPVIDQLERGLRIDRDDSQGQKLDKLDAVLRDLALPAEDHGPVLASLLSVPVDGRYEALEVTPKELRRKTLGSLVSVFEAMATRTPVLTVVEDAHWMDPSTEELLGLLIERVRTSPHFLVVTHRPEYAPPWGEHPIHPS